MESEERRERSDDDPAAGASAAGGPNFECNICLDVAHEAVVSMCG